MPRELGAFINGVDILQHTKTIGSRNATYLLVGANLTVHIYINSITASTILNHHYLKATRLGVGEPRHAVRRQVRVAGCEQHVHRAGRAVRRATSPAVEPMATP